MYFARSSSETTIVVALASLALGAPNKVAMIQHKINAVKLKFFIYNLLENCLASLLSLTKQGFKELALGPN